MANWKTESQKIDGGGTGRTQPRERTITRHAPKRHAFSVSISEPVNDDLSDIAAAMGISKNHLINVALEAFIDDYYKKLNKSMKKK